MSPHDPETKYTKTESDLIKCIDALCDIVGAAVDKSSPENLENAVEDFKDTAQIAVNSVEDPRGPIGPIGPIPKKEYNAADPENDRKMLIDLCERSIVNVKSWANRDTHYTQEKIGTLWALLKAGCEFRIMDRESDGELKTNDQMIWIEVSEIPGFNYMDAGGAKATETFYLPTPKRLAERSGDWY